MRVERFEDRLLEGPALGGALLALGADLLELVLLVAQRLQLLLELAQLLQQRALGGVRAAAASLIDAHGGGLEVGQRVAVVGGGELAHEVLARLGERLGHGLAHAVLHRGRAAVAEAALELLGQLAVVLAEDVGELVLEELRDRARPVGELDLNVLGGLLELGLDELGVGAGLLAVEHAGADLDGVTDRLDRVVAAVLALAHETDGAVVLDDEAVDDDAIAERSDMGRPEWSCSFHGYLVAPYGPDLTEWARSCSGGQPGGGKDPWQPARVPGRRARRVLQHGPPFHERPNVVHAGQESRARGDLEVGRIELRAPDRALVQQAVDAVEQARQLRQVAAHVRILGLVEAGGREDDRCRRCARPRPPGSANGRPPGSWRPSSGRA